MSQTSPRLLAGLLATSAIVSVALAWSGWRLFDQQRGLDTRLAQDRTEAAATAMAASIREQLAELGDHMTAQLSPLAESTTDALPKPLPGMVVVVQRAEGLAVEPPGALPFLPTLQPPPQASPLFAPGEAAEFPANNLDRAVAHYTTLTRHSDPLVQAGAWVRLGRALRKSGRTDEAIRAYAQLGTLGDLVTDSFGAPASLVALDGQRLAYRQRGDSQNERRVADEIRQRLERGDWRLTRGIAAFYRDEVSNDPPSKGWQFAEALSTAWPDGARPLGPRGHTVLSPANRPVLIVWRTEGAQVAMGTIWLDEFAAAVADATSSWQLVDADDLPLAGAAASGTPISRVIAAGGPAWTLRLWPQEVALAGGRGSVLLAVFAAMLAFVWGATYFMARALRREAAVARQQSDFVAAVSHEFRTPLSTMRQMTEMLDAGRVPGEARRHHYYQVLAGEAARLQRLVETLLSFGRLEAGREPYQFADLDLNTLVDAVVSDIGAEPRCAGRDITSELPPGRLRVRGDEEALRLAMRNLLDNAIKYSPSDSPIRVRVTSNERHVAIGVSDEGSGIPAGEQRAIFGKFVRGRAAVDTHVPGTGIGLAIVQRIVAAHDGAISLTSAPGCGSTFTMRFPVLPDTEVPVIGVAREGHP